MFVSVAQYFFVLIMPLNNFYASYCMYCELHDPCNIDPLWYLSTWREKMSQLSIIQKEDCCIPDKDQKYVRLLLRKPSICATLVYLMQEISIALGSLLLSLIVTFNVYKEHVKWLQIVSCTHWMLDNIGISVLNTYSIARSSPYRTLYSDATCCTSCLLNRQRDD